jgi:hypothetical protein
LYFSKFIAFRVVQKYDNTMFVAKLGQSRVEALNLLNSLILGDWIRARVICAGQPVNAVSGQLAFLYGVHALSRETAFFVDKQVVHHTTKPRARLIDGREIVDLAVGLDQQFLEQVFRFRFAAGKPPGETVQAIEVRSHQALESQIVVRGAHNVAECSAVPLADKEAVGNFAVNSLQHALLVESGIPKKSEPQ